MLTDTSTLAPRRRPVRPPTPPADMNAPQYGGDDLTPSMGSGTDAAPQSPPWAATNTVARRPAPSTANDATPSVPGTGGATAITQLPDGAGGAVPVPPITTLPTTPAPSIDTPRPQPAGPYTPLPDGTPNTPLPGTVRSDGTPHTPANIAAANDWWSTHNSDGSTRMPWSGGAAIGAEDPRYASLPGTETLNRALNITPGQANADDNPVRGFNGADVDADGLLTSDAIARYNTPEQLAAMRAASPSGAASNAVIPQNAGLPPEGGSAPWDAPTSQTIPSKLTPQGATDVAPWSPGTEPAVATAPGAAPAYDPASTFDEENNLIDAQVLPTANPRLLKLQGMQDKSLDAIANGPDRLALAKNYWDDFSKSTESDYQHDLTDATNRAGESGYLGAGRLTNAYGDAQERRQTSRDVAKSGFLNKALEGTIGDRRNTLSDISGVEDQAYGEGAQGRNEVRTERDYQRTLAEQAITRRIQQAAAEAGLSQQDFMNALRLYDVGNENNPTGAYENAAALASGEAAGNATSVADLIRMIAARQRPAPAGV